MTDHRFALMAFILIVGEIMLRIAREFRAQGFRPAVRVLAIFLITPLSVACAWLFSLLVDLAL